MPLNKRKQVRLLCAVGAAALGLPLYLIAPGGLTKRQKAPFYGVNFAHRGLHSRDMSVPENSLAAFELAAKAGVSEEAAAALVEHGYLTIDGLGNASAEDLAAIEELTDDDRAGIARAVEAAKSAAPAGNTAEAPAEPAGEEPVAEQP